MAFTKAVLPSNLILDPLLHHWLLEDMGRGDRTTDGLLSGDDIYSLPHTSAYWVVKEAGVVAGLAIAHRVFTLLDDQVQINPQVTDGEWCEPGTIILRINGSLRALLTGERVALNLVMGLSGIATATRHYVDAIADLPTRLVDTRKTTPGLRILEKYASQVGGAVNHRMGLDDAVMLKDNHIVAAGGIGKAMARVRHAVPYPLTIEVETETMTQVIEAVEQGADIIMLDNMPIQEMVKAVQYIRQHRPLVPIEASGNITLTTIRSVAETGVDYISTSAPITRSSWLDISMRLMNPSL